MDAGVAAATGALVAIGLALQQGPLDLLALQWLNGIGPLAPALWSGLAVAGLGLSVLLLAGAPGPAGARPLSAAFLMIVLGGLLVHALKSSLMDQRPLAVLGAQAVHVIGEPLRTRSMPSGHTALAFAVAGWCWVGSGWRRSVRVAVWVLAVLVGLSRVAVGAHWPSDVLAGAGLGLAVAWALHRSGWDDALAERLTSRLGARIAALALVLGTLSMATSGTGYPLAAPLQVAIVLAGGLGAWRWGRHGWPALAGARSP